MSCPPHSRGWQNHPKSQWDTVIVCRDSICFVAFLGMNHTSRTLPGEEWNPSNLCVLASVTPIVLAKKTLMRNWSIEAEMVALVIPEFSFKLRSFVFFLLKTMQIHKCIDILSCVVEFKYPITLYYIPSKALQLKVAVLRVGCQIKSVHTHSNKLINCLLLHNWYSHQSIFSLSHNMDRLMIFKMFRFYFFG